MENKDQLSTYLFLNYFAGPFQVRLFVATSVDTRRDASSESENQKRDFHTIPTLEKLEEQKWKVEGMRLKSEEVKGKVVNENERREGKDGEIGIGCGCEI